MFRKHVLLAPVILAALLATALRADEVEETGDEPATYTVQKTSVKMIAELEGVVVAETMHDLRVEPQSWEEFVVSEAVPHGRQVRQGDVLIRFDSRKLEEAIADLQAEEELADLAIEMAEQDLPQHERSLQLDLEAAERAMRFAKEDADRFSELRTTRRRRKCRVDHEIGKVLVRVLSRGASTAGENV